MHTRPVLVAALVAACLAVAVAAPAAGQAGPAVGFGDTTSEVAQGDVATIEVQLRNTDAATLRVRAADQTYRATLRVRDRDGDGTVRVRFDTFRAAGDEPETAFTAAGPDDEADLLADSRDGSGRVLGDGRYNLIVSTSETSVASRLSVVEPGPHNGTGTAVVAPDTPLPTADGSATNASDADPAANDSDTGSTTAAAGDRFRTRFAVRGLGGIAAGDAPGRNLVFPTDSAPGARTTHAVSTSPDESVAVRAVTVEYGTDGSVPPRGVHRISRSDIETLGVDATGDGYVDRSARIAVQNIRTSTDGRLTITFDRPIEVGATDGFLVSYAAQNPDTTDTQGVTVTLDGDETTHRDRGAVRYGPAGQGTLGHGVDLRVASADRDGGPTDPLAALETAYDPAAGALVADADTGALGRGDHAVTLSVGDAAPEPLPRAELTERVAVVAPTATVTDLSTAGTSRLSVTAETNLAPENSLVIQVRAEESGGGISQVLNCVTTVGSDGATGCEFDLERSTANFDIEVSVRRGDEVIAGPVRYD